MKKMILVCLVALACSGNLYAAVGPNSSWEQIYAAGLSPDFPQIQFNTTFVTIDGVCVAGDQLHTKMPVELCTEYGHGENGQCKKWESVILSTPITYTYEYCVGHGEHCHWETGTATHALSYEIAVKYIHGNSEQIRFYKHYDISACQ